MNGEGLVAETVFLMPGEGQLIRDSYRCPNTRCRHLTILHDHANGFCNVEGCSCQGRRR